MTFELRRSLLAYTVPIHMRLNSDRNGDDESPFSFSLSYSGGQDSSVGKKFGSAI